MGFSNWSIYQTDAWLGLLEETEQVRPLRLGIFRGEELVGLWAGADFRKGPFRLCGSPMRGWMTAYMGPACDTVEPLGLLKAWCAFLRENGYHHAEVHHPSFTAEVASQAGLEAVPGDTYVGPIPPTEEEILRLFKKSCRESIRKSVRHGVEVEDTDSPAFVDHFYYHIQDVFGKQGLQPTFPKTQVQALWKRLKPTGRLITVWAKREGKVIATEMSIIGNNILHAFAWASLRSAQEHAPNEPVQLLALTLAAQKGCTRHEVCGGGQYKLKFGTHLEPAYAVLYYRNALLPICRKMYAAAMRLRLKRGGFGVQMPPRPPLDVAHHFEPY
ncbi:MAG: GNAT family N-acetyltransferase [Planctomycetaceae bacterium]|nr:GNAT family N-acetyltransferase [Planctomycetaceae bacterium]